MCDKNALCVATCKDMYMYISLDKVLITWLQNYRITEVKSTRPSKILCEDNYEFSFKITSKSLWVIRVNERRSKVKHDITLNDRAMNRKFCP